MGVLREKIIKGTLVLGGVNVLIRVFSLITVIVITRHLSVRDYGIFVLFLSLMGPFNIFSGLGMDELVTADVARSFGEQKFGYAKKLLMSFSKLRFGLLLALAAVGWIFRSFIETRYGLSFQEYFVYLLLLVFLQYFRNVYGMIFQVREKFTTVAIMNTLEIVVKLLVVLVIVIIGTLTLTNLIWAYIITAAITTLVFYPSAHKTFKHIPNDATPAINAPIMKPLIFGHGKWQMGLNIISTLMAPVTYWLIKIIISTEAVAVFSLAQSMFSALAALVPFKTIMLPIIARKSADLSMIAHITERVTKYGLILFTAIIVVGLLAVGPMVVWAFPKYLAAAGVFQILIFKLLFNPFSFSQVPFLYAHKEQKFLFLAAIFDAMLVIILAPFLMDLFGIVGLVYQALINLLLMTSMREWYLRHKYFLKSITLKALFSFDKYDQVLLAEVIQKFKSKFGIRPLVE